MKEPVKVFVLGEHSVHLYEETGFNLNESAASGYDYIYIKDTGYRPASLVGIRIFTNGIAKASCIVGSDGGATGIHKHSAIISQNELMLCCSDTVFKLNIPDLSLQWNTMADSITCFGIYPHNNGCLVHGELEITCLNTSGQIIWQVGGRDIWITPEGADDDFKIFDNYIIARDWGHNRYKIDFNGNITDYNENNI